MFRKVAADDAVHVLLMLMDDSQSGLKTDLNDGDEEPPHVQSGVAV